MFLQRSEFVQKFDPLLLLRNHLKPRIQSNSRTYTVRTDLRNKLKVFGTFFRFPLLPYTVFAYSSALFLMKDFILTRLPTRPCMRRVTTFRLSSVNVSFRDRRMKSAKTQPSSGSKSKDRTLPTLPLLTLNCGCVSPLHWILWTNHCLTMLDCKRCDESYIHIDCQVNIHSRLCWTVIQCGSHS